MQFRFKREMEDDPSREYLIPPARYVRCFYEPVAFWRTTLDGSAELLHMDDNDYQFFFGRRGKKKPYKTKISFKKRRKYLLNSQHYIYEMLCCVFGFPFYLQAIDDLANYVFEDRNWQDRTEARTEAKWQLSCLTGFALIHFFGGVFRYDKSKKLAVSLDRVPVDVYVEQKVMDKEGLAFHLWLYNLCCNIWKHLNHDEYLKLDYIDYIRVKERI